MRKHYIAFHILIAYLVLFAASNSLYGIFSNDADISTKDATTIPEYTMLDLGTLDADESKATAINDKGQVLGWVEYGGKRYSFLWEAEKGLQILDALGNTLNNRGQITGYNYIWDPVIGEFHINIPDCSISMINDNWQGIGKLSVQEEKKKIDHAVFWDRGNITDLYNEFYAQVPGDWYNIYTTCLNNQGHVVLQATQKVPTTDGKFIQLNKAFLWKNGFFKIISPEDTQAWINCNKIDDLGNMIVNISTKGTYLINSQGVKVAKVPFEDYTKIINQKPVTVFRLPGEIKKDLDGQSYFSQGVEIRKLIEEEGPFYNVKSGSGHNTSTKIRDQNSSGIVVGDADTFLSGRHAFIAYPRFN